MKLFTRKTKKVEEDVVSAIMNPETLNINPEPSTPQELEKIIKTTDSMNIISAIEGQDITNPRKKTKQDLAGVREAIYRSFDLARRKIATEYEQIIVSGNYVDNAYLAVQITVKNFEKKWNVEYVESVVKKFTDALPEQLSLGKTILIANDIVIEPIIYVDKVLPSWKITPDFALLTNALKWEEVVDHLIEEDDLSQDAKEIVGELVEAISSNVKNGYYVKLSRFIVLQIYPGSAQKIVLFSNDTLKKMNDIYSRFLKTGERKQINKYDTVTHFDKTQVTVAEEFLNQDAREVINEVKFLPTDLETEITPELEEKLNEKKDIDKEVKLIEEAKDIKFAVEKPKAVKAKKGMEVKKTPKTTIKKEEVAKEVVSKSAKKTKKVDQTQEINLVDAALGAKTKKAPAKNVVTKKVVVKPTPKVVAKKVTKKK